MDSPKKIARVDTLELRAQLFKLLGNERAELYFRGLKRFLGCQLGKEEFNKICVAALGKENIKLHNSLIRSICSNAPVPQTDSFHGSTAPPDAANVEDVRAGLLLADEPVDEDLSKVE